MLVKFVPALVTVKVVVAWMPLVCALMVTTPTATPLAMPEEFTVAIVLSEELHCAVAVRSLVPPSENEAIAVNCLAPPTPIDTEPGKTCRAVTEAGTGVGEGVGDGVDDGFPEFVA